MSISTRRMTRGVQGVQGGGGGGGGGGGQNPYNYGFTVGSESWLSNATSRRAYFADMVSMKASWVRIDASWASIQGGGSSSWNYGWLDGIVTDARSAGLNVLMIPAYAPGWCAASGGTSPPSDPAYYATFLNNLVARYYPQGVTSYEIWNEPNNATFWAPGPNAANYVALLRAAYPAAKAAASGCTVITGGTAPEPESGFSPRQWLTALYANGAKPYFDAVGHHPYSYPYTPSQYAEWSAWDQTAQTTPSLRSIMTANGDSAKKIWMTEQGIPTDGNASTNQLLGQGYTIAQCEAIQATNDYEAVTYAATYSWAGPLFIWTYIDRVAYGATTDVEAYWGVYKSDGSAKPAVAQLRSL